jgi:hypothetical protein
MKKLLLLPIAALLFSSCDQGPKNELEAQENIAENIESGKVYGPVDYNDGLLAESMLVDVKFAMLRDLDDKDVSAEDMKAACAESMEEYDRVMSALGKIEPYGEKGGDFKTAIINYVRVAGRFFNMYNDYADQLAIPDTEWADEDLENWDEIYTAIMDDFSAVNDIVIEVQSEYASLNRMLLEDKGSDAEEIYEESIQPEEL